MVTKETLTTAQLELEQSSIYAQIAAAKSSIKAGMEAKLSGHTVVLDKKLKDPTSGEYHQVEVEATITGTTWSYEDEMLLKVSYVHPFTGKMIETEAPMY